MEVAWTPFSKVATGQWDREDRFINILPIIQNLWREGGREGRTGGCLDSRLQFCKCFGCKANRLN